MPRLLEVSLRRRAALCLPSTISLLRLIALPLLILSLEREKASLFTPVFLLAVASDYADGYAARKLQICSKRGATLDFTMDFLFIEGMFLYFSLKAIYPVWIPILIAAMFAQFLITSKLTTIIYDPLGKYYGSLLYSTIGLTILFPWQLVRDMVIVALVCLSLTCFGSRLIYLFNRVRKI